MSSSSLPSLNNRNEEPTSSTSEINSIEINEFDNVSDDSWTTYLTNTSDSDTEYYYKIKKKRKLKQKSVKPILTASPTFKCPICLHESSSITHVLIPCGHVFCKSCIRSMLQNVKIDNMFILNLKCGICRASAKVYNMYFC